MFFSIRVFLNSCFFLKRKQLKGEIHMDGLVCRPIVETSKPRVFEVFSLRSELKKKYTFMARTEEERRMW